MVVAGYVYAEANFQSGFVAEKLKAEKFRA